MPSITTAPATAGRWDDVVAAMTGGGDGGDCWCRWFHESAAQWRASTAGERRAALEHEIEAGPPRGLVGYVDGRAAGWVRVAPRLEQPRLRRSRIARASPAPASDGGVWAITCFQVRREFRGIGMVAVLLDAAVEFARAEGAASIEGYPIDTEATDVTSNDLYHGPASAFLAAGFEEVARPSATRPLLRLQLTGSPADR